MLLIANVQREFTSVLRGIQQARLFQAIHQLFSTAALHLDTLTEGTLSPLTSLSSSVLSTFTSQLQQDASSLFSDGQNEAVERIAILSAVTAYRTKLALESNEKEGQDLVNHLCVNAMREFSLTNQAATLHKEQLASSLLKWLLVQSNPSQNVVDTRAFFSKWAAFNALLGKCWLPSHVLQLELNY